MVDPMTAAEASPREADAVGVVMSWQQIARPCAPVLPNESIDWRKVAVWTAVAAPGFVLWAGVGVLAIRLF